jgi:hypothetical protein
MRFSAMIQTVFHAIFMERGLICSEMFFATFKAKFELESSRAKNSSAIREVVRQLSTGRVKINTKLMLKYLKTIYTILMVKNAQKYFPTALLE